MPELTISPEHYRAKDIDYISDMIGDILAEYHEVVVDAISFEIKVSYTEAEDYE